MSRNRNPFIPTDDILQVFEAVGITQGDFSVTKEEKHNNIFSGKQMIESLPQAREVRASGKLLIGGKKTALVVLSYNRPQSVLKTVQGIKEVLTSVWNRFTVDLIFSQDGDDKANAIVIENIARRMEEIPFITVSSLTHKQESPDRNAAYTHVSNHIAFVLDQLLKSKKYDQVILLDVGFLPPLSIRMISSSLPTSLTT